jgi:cyclopropane-fatty-acyl-phospholipid synthase
MKGGGYYDEHSEYQRRVAQSALTPLTDLVQRMDGVDADPLSVVDYGCSEGANSIAAIREVVVAIRHRQERSCIVAAHNDLPTNDFNALFHNLIEHADSYLTVPGGPILPMASPRSFYETVVPQASVTVGLSFSAAHWFRDTPGAAVPRSMCAMDATGSAQVALSKQADDDWTRFLTMRASELGPGGLLFVQMIGTQVDSDGTRHVTAERLLHAMYEVAEGMVEEGHLRREALDKFVFPTYMRTADEARAPLERPGSPLAGNFRPDRVTVEPVPNPYLDALHQDGDKHNYSARYIAFVRAFTESTLRRALFEPGTTDAPVDGNADRFYTELQCRTAADPEWSAFEDWTLTIALTRTARAESACQADLI